MEKNEFEIEYTLQNKTQNSKIRPVHNLVKIEYVDKTPKKVMGNTKEYLMRVISEIDLKKPVRIVMKNMKESKLDLSVEMEDEVCVIEVNRNRYYLYRMILGLFLMDMDISVDEDDTKMNDYDTAVDATVSFFKSVETNKKTGLKKFVPPEVAAMVEM